MPSDGKGLMETLNPRGQVFHMNSTFSLLNVYENIEFNLHHHSFEKSSS